MSGRTTSRPQIRAAHAKAMVPPIKALANQTRLLILHSLMSGEQTVGQLQLALGKPQSLISTNLAILSDVGMVSSRAKGTRVTYSLPQIGHRQLHHILKTLFGTAV